jgi:predicted RNA-binding protein with PIN domain
MVLKKKRSYLGKKSKITVVFDGKQTDSDISYRNDEDIEIVFTQNESADDWIKNKVKSSKEVKDMVVVSDDKEIIFFTKSYVKNYMSVDEFVEKLLPAKVKLDDFVKPELSFKEVVKINEELKRIWIKE